MKNIYKVLFKRIVHILIVLLLLSFIIFAFIRLIPGDPVKISLGPMVPEETVQKMRSELYFDRPLVVQYGHWLKGVLTEGDFGTSLYTKRSVTTDIIEYLPRTLELVIYSALIILIMGVFLGTISSIFKNTWVDNLVRIISYIGVVTPPYAFGVFFMLIFGYILKWFPIGGMPDISPEYVKTGMLGFDALLAGDFAKYFEVLRYLFLPVMSLSLHSIAYQARIHRSSMVEKIQTDYIDFAKVSGIKRSTLILKHMMKPSFIPTFTIYGLQIGALLGNAFIIEVIFRFSGFSQYSLNVILNKDPYAIVAVTFIFGIVFAIVNLLIDIGVSRLDPRIGLEV